jgi:ribonuclease R
MTIDKTGKVTHYEISPSIIRSKKRFTYNEVQFLIDANENEMLLQMDELREILRAKREQRGALDFDLPESKIRVDENGRVISIEAYPRNNATGIIEEFMILCNETIATHFFTRKIPFVYRSHDAPSAEKFAAVQTLIANMGLLSKKAKPKRPTASNLQSLLSHAKETTAAYAISSALLRALPQAVYSPHDPSHFGLASDAYCHFTSPIRRYADLQIHRIIKFSWLHPEPFELFEKDFLPAVCAQCSRTERVAEALEREVAELKKVQFMADKEGQKFDAVVSGLTPWGAFVMLENTAEGLVPVANLTKHGYRYDKEICMYQAKRKKGEKQAKTLHHGSPIKVRLVNANEDERKLTFALG